MVLIVAKSGTIAGGLSAPPHWLPVVCATLFLFIVLVGALGVSLAISAKRADEDAERWNHNRRGKGSDEHR